MQGELSDKYYNFDTLKIEANDSVYKKESDFILNDISDDNSNF